MNENTDAAAIFAPLWKRKWLILLVGILVGAATYFYYDHETPEYGASTGIYLGGGSEVKELLGDESSAESDRSISNQVVLINSTVVGEAVARQLAKEGNVEAARGAASAVPAEGSDFISISSRADTGQGAADLANAYAQEYLRLRQAAYKRNVNAALSSTEQQLDSVSAERGSETLQAQDLIERINRLRSQLSLGDTGDQQINPAVAAASPLSPKPRRNAVFGFVLGIALAAIAAYALSRFDRRLRSLADIERVFHSPLLAAVPSIRRPIEYREGRPTPAAAMREPMRRLHTTLQLNSSPDAINQVPSPRVVLFTSADAGDGKSTLVAGLALAQAEAGEHVAIVESDMRRPTQGRLLSVDGSNGLAEVLAGALGVEGATQRVPIILAPAEAPEPAALATAVQPRPLGSVSVLPGGGTVANPPALLSGRAMPMLLQSLAEEYSYVLIDAPSPLEVSDVLPVLAIVDAIVIVARVGHTGETSAQRLIDLFSRAPHAPVVGTVANDASSADMEAFGLSSSFGPSGWRL